MPRNASGTYTLPNPPVVTNTTIDSADENDTRDDLANEITNSLDRAGRGGMTAALKVVDGTAASPGLQFSSDANNGLYRNGADDWSMSAGSIEAANLTSTGFKVMGFKLNTLSPPQITSDQNDYNPTSLSTASYLRLDTDAARNLTGLQGGVAGRTIRIHYIGATTLTLKDESASSTAAYRFALPADLVLGPDMSVDLTYDATTSRWRMVTGAVSSAMAPVTLATSLANARTALGLGTMATANSVAAANIDAGAVTTAKIADDAVTQAKLAASTFCARSTGRNFGSSNTNSAVTFTADEFVVADTNGKTYKLTSVNVTADITASGANGLDTGAEASNTWYYTHVIYNPTTDTKAALLSLSATAPTLPSGYTAWALASARRNDGSSNFIAMTQKGAELSYSAKQSLLSSGTATTETSVTTSTFLPSVAHDFQLEIESFLTSNAGPAQNSSLIRAVSGSNFAKAHSYCGFSSDTDLDMNTARVPNTGNLYYLNSTGGSVASATTSLAILSFSLPIGGQ